MRALPIIWKRTRRQAFMFASLSLLRSSSLLSPLCSHSCRSLARAPCTQWHCCVGHHTTAPQKASAAAAEQASTSLSALLSAIHSRVGGATSNRYRRRQAARMQLRWGGRRRQGAFQASSRGASSLCFRENAGDDEIFASGCTCHGQVVWTQRNERPFRE